MEVETKEVIQARFLSVESAEESQSSRFVRKVKTRFGEISINTEKSICFRHGLLGIPGVVHFCVADFPSDKMAQFKLLQCVEDDNLCFITIPAEFNNNVIRESDLQEGCNMLSIQPENLILFFIVTVHREQEELQISINARAPIFVDVETATASQFVLSNSEYKVRHYIS